MSINHKTGRMRDRATAFTLVEMLVVIGIIGLLLAVLLPVLASARRGAKAVTCASQQRQIVVAMIGRSEDHGGYLPLAGTVAVPDVTGPDAGLAPLLNDSARRRYDYLKSRTVSDPPTGETVAPTQLSVLKWLGDGGIPEKAGDLTARINAGGQERVEALFRCPEVADRELARPSVALTVGSATTIMLWPVITDYGFNEGVLGFDHTDSGRRRLRGNRARINDPSRTLLTGDMGSAPNVANVMTWRPPLDAPSGVISLADTLAGAAPETTSPHFDLDRHRGQINLAFADGHVEARQIDEASLREVILTGD